MFRLRRVKILDMIEVNDEDRIKAEIYFNEQQQLLNQPQIYYNGIVQTAPQMISSNSNGPIQLDHQLYSITQSPRLKPITIVDKQLISNVQNANNANPKFRGQNNNNINNGVNTNNINNNVNNANNSSNLNKIDKMSKEMSSRYRNQY